MAPAPAVAALEVTALLLLKDPESLCTKPLRTGLEREWKAEEGVEAAAAAAVKAAAGMMVGVEEGEDRRIPMALSRALPLRDAGSRESRVGLRERGVTAAAALALALPLLLLLPPLLLLLPPLLPPPLPRPGEACAWLPLGEAFSLAAMAAAATTEDASLAASRASLGKASSPARAEAPALGGVAAGMSLGLTMGLPRALLGGLRMLLGDTGGGDRPGRGGTPPPLLLPPPVTAPVLPPPPLLLLLPPAPAIPPPLLPWRPGDLGLLRPRMGDSSAARPGER